LGADRPAVVDTEEAELGRHESAGRGAGRVASVVCRLCHQDRCVAAPRCSRGGRHSTFMHHEWHCGALQW